MVSASSHDRGEAKVLLYQTLVSRQEHIPCCQQLHAYESSIDEASSVRQQWALMNSMMLLSCSVKPDDMVQFLASDEEHRLADSFFLASNTAFTSFSSVLGASSLFFPGEGF